MVLGKNSETVRDDLKALGYTKFKVTFTYKYKEDWDVNILFGFHVGGLPQYGHIPTCMPVKAVKDRECTEFFYQFIQKGEYMAMMLEDDGRLLRRRESRALWMHALVCVCITGSKNH